MLRRKKDPSLTKIIVVIVVLLAVAYGVYRGTTWFNSAYSGGTVQAAAPNRLDEAKQLIADGKTEEARKLLDPIARKTRDENVTPQALMLLARLDEEKGDTDKAMSHLKTAMDSYSRSRHQPNAALAYARLLEKSGKQDEALALYQDIRDGAPKEFRAPALVGLGRFEESQKNLAAARDLFREAVPLAEWNGDTWIEAVNALGKLNVALIFSPQSTPDSQTYVVVSGDTLINIGVKLNTTQGLLMTANHLDANSTLHIGQRLKYTPKDFHIVIERSANRLFLFDGDGLFKMYPVGLGMPGFETTLGSYKIGNKQIDPVWFKPGHGPVPAGDPANELGTRWMPLEPEREGLPTDLGIHGTIAPETIGQKMSHGCPRMYPADVEELYDLVVRSTPVEIVETFPGTTADPETQVAQRPE